MKNLREGTIALNDTIPYGNVTVEYELDTCLGCLACDTSCPADIRYSDLLEDLRKTLFQRNPEYKTRLDAFLHEMPVDDPRKLRRLMSLLALAQRLGIIWIIRNTFLKNLLPLRKREMLNLLVKKIPYRPSSLVLPGVNLAVGKRKMRVAIFPGCINDQLFADANLAAVRVLQRLGVEVLVPAGARCCGAIHYHVGECEVSAQLAEENSKRFLDLQIDAIVVNAAGCGLFMKSYGKAFPNSSRAPEVSRKVKDVHEAIWELVQNDPTLKEQWIWPRSNTKVTYHEACHLVHGQGISATPLKLLQMIQGLECVPLNEASMCCGSAGVYNIFHSKLARPIQSRKVDNILDTKADIVAVANPGCNLQIVAGLQRKGRNDIKCYHPVELIDLSWREA